ncbi:Uu.00g128950.m01.CDS01 [Anthostomella pinea]|uniref:Protein YOP1 n=1 Tax=Anthostomella pinea TaxID=933095 RepID=A0AAI8VJ51_9PEZI|nr:Uu.00g128950.m01.CDS01 [Anthostomella pinea]
MFNIIAHFFSSIASFLFPLFASYKALKTSDPAQLTPWLMYWSVFMCVLLVESWTDFILVWVPFYSWMRLAFLLWLVLPSTQGARKLYEGYLHPYLEENELAIEDFIARGHDRLKAAGLSWLKRFIEYVRTQVFNMQPSQTRDDETRASAAPQGYTQALLARFSVPAARWAASSNAVGGGHDFYNMLAGAVSAAATAGGGGAGSVTTSSNNMAASGTLIPENIGSATEKMSFITAQKERLAFLMGTLDQEAQQLEKDEADRKIVEQAQKELRPVDMNLDGQESGSRSRPTSGHSAQSGLSKSRSEVDFEKIDAESGAEDNAGELRRRAAAAADETPGAERSGWNIPFWGAVGGSKTTGYQE